METFRSHIGSFPVPPRSLPATLWKWSQVTVNPLPPLICSSLTGPNSSTLPPSMPPPGLHCDPSVVSSGVCYRALSKTHSPREPLTPFFNTSDTRTTHLHTQLRFFQRISNGFCVDFALSFLQNSAYREDVGYSSNGQRVLYAKITAVTNIPHFAPGGPPRAVCVPPPGVLGL